MNNDKKYNVSLLNECFRHLNQNGNEQLSYTVGKQGEEMTKNSKNPVVGYVISKNHLENYKEDPCHNISNICPEPKSEVCPNNIEKNNGKSSTNLYNDLCKIFGHEEVNIKYLQSVTNQKEVENAGVGVDPEGGLWPHKTNCNLWKNEKFNPNVSKAWYNHFNEDNIFISEIECL